MFDIAWGEFIVIGAVALIVIGPKELPSVLRTVGQWTTKIRRMGAEFQNQFQEAMREAEMADLKKEVESLNEATIKSAIYDPSTWHPKDDAPKSADADSGLAVVDDGTTAPVPEAPPAGMLTPVPDDAAAAPEAASPAAGLPDEQSATRPAAGPDLPGVATGAGAASQSDEEARASSGSPAAAAPVGTNGHA